MNDKYARAKREAIDGHRWPGSVGEGPCLAGLWLLKAGLVHVPWSPDPEVRVANFETAWTAAFQSPSGVAAAS
jgi:hypothetical protein